MNDLEKRLIELSKSDYETTKKLIGLKEEELKLIGEKNKAEKGILICGSGNGVCITANKHAGVRAALCWNEELAALARQHNDANVLCIPSRFITSETAYAMVNTFMVTSFEGGRHQKRVEKISL